MSADDPKEWRVDWQHRHTGATGEGVNLMTKEEARTLAHHLTQRKPAFHQSVVHVPPATTDTNKYDPS